MSIQDNDILPLLDFWLRLRKAGLSVSIDDYSHFLYALRHGFGIEDKAALKHLCYALWIRSDDERRLFDYHFDQIMTPVGRFQLPDTPLPQPAEKPSIVPPLPADKKQDGDATKYKEIEEEVVEAIQTSELEHEISSTKYDFSDEYFPLTRQQMKQSWRYLRHLVRTGHPIELDIEATVQEVGRTGVFLEPVLTARPRQMARLLLLIDHGGSMVPFHMLSQRLVKTLLSEGASDEVDIYYFRNYPTEYLYYDTANQKYKKVKEVLSDSNASWTGVLVFSDAGAARGSFSSNRIRETEHFIKQFAQSFRHIVWLNPVPHEYWSGSTASIVKRSVPMFDLNNHGLDATIDVLCGRSPRNGYKLETYPS